jgi:hypothetical protein
MLSVTGLKFKHSCYQHMILQVSLTTWLFSSNLRITISQNCFLIFICTDLMKWLCCHHSMDFRACQEGGEPNGATYFYFTWGILTAARCPWIRSRMPKTIQSDWSGYEINECRLQTSDRSLMDCILLYVFTTTPATPGKWRKMYSNTISCIPLPVLCTMKFVITDTYFNNLLTLS